MTTYRAAPWDILQLLFKTEKLNNHVLHFSGTCSPGLASLRLKQAVALLADSFPLIRCNLHMLRGRPVWCDGGYTPDDIVSLIETEDLEAAQNGFLMQEIDETSGPQMKIALLKTSDQDELCIIMNHMLCDAAGFKEVLYRLASLYTALESGIAVKNDSMMADRTVAQISKSLPLKTRFGMYFHRGKLSPRGKQRFSFEGDPATPFIERRSVSRDEFTRIKKYAASRTATVNDVFAAACIRVLAAVFGTPDILPCAVDIRRFLYGRHAAGACNLVTTISCDIGQELPASFEDSLSRVKSCMDTRKNDPSCMKNLVLLENFFNSVPFGIAFAVLKKVFNNPPISFTNIGILDERKLSFGTTAFTDAFMTGSIKYPDYFQMSLSTFKGKADCCVNLYGTERDRRIIASFLDSVMKELDSL